MDAQTETKIIETLGRLDERTERMDRSINGNGQPGLLQRVNELEASKNQALGAMGILGTVGAIIWGFLEYLFHLKK